MFHVPRHAGGHPRLTLALITATVLGMAVVAGVASSRSVVSERPTEARALAAITKPPVEVVQALPELTEALDRVSRGGRGFNGAVLVARGDQVLFRQVYGMADHEQGRPLALGSKFRLASVSKQFTAAAILKLQDEGVLSVDDPLCKWIQPCPEAWAPIRLSHLLSHTSGVPDLMARPAWGLQRITPMTAEQLTGVSLATYLQQTFFTPLGMKDTGSDADGKARDLVTGYAHFPGGLTPQNDANVSIVFGAGALYSTLDDMLIWERALHHGRVVSPTAYAQMTADHAPDSTPKERGRPRRDWGFGLFANSLGQRVTPAFDDRQIYHTGSWSGFRNLVTWQPDADVRGAGASISDVAGALRRANGALTASKSVGPSASDRATRPASTGQRGP